MSISFAFSVWDLKHTEMLLKNLAVYLTVIKQVLRYFLLQPYRIQILNLNIIFAGWIKMYDFWHASLPPAALIQRWSAVSSSKTDVAWRDDERNNVQISLQLSCSLPPCLLSSHPSTVRRWLAEGNNSRAGEASMLFRRKWDGARGSEVCERVCWKSQVAEFSLDGRKKCTNSLWATW